MKTIGERIKQKRTELNWSQGDLAACISKTLPVSKVSISQWEKGEVKNLKHKYIVCCAECFAVTPLWLDTGISNDDQSEITGLNENAKTIVNIVKSSQEFLTREATNDIKVFILTRLQFELRQKSKLYRDVLQSYHSVYSIAEDNKWYEVSLESQKIMVLNHYKEKLNDKISSESEQQAVNMIDLLLF
jgi:transcriptional regulator with XRE-family HTH domain